ncbi:hypothetical protein FEF65_08245 [Mariprofundus erugo]|uniref:Cytochrome c domain-containing protein n=1 Tax=Mariprofundus erugo TaxID=2528639 RepID=A0A5R9GUR3_9PROT|nr:hypothetical protein [Mariprofundus erugo]TLS66944.1 hypothetical protein FEF65_08245 [Mariprofundus erugo]
MSRTEDCLIDSDQDTHPDHEANTGSLSQIYIRGYYNMKKMLLSAAAFAVVAVSAVAVAPTTSEAIPAFARQTGAACLSCHFQTFPAINAFGRAFKMGSFTDVGEQALVEDDNLSIPSVLNATVVIRGNYTNTATTGLTSNGAWAVPSETPILIAGRIGSNSGAFVEFANGGAGAAAGVTVGNWQFINSFDMGGFKIGAGMHNSGFGGSAIMEVSNVFGQHSGKLAGGNLSAINAAGFNAATIGAGMWVGNEMGNLQLSLVAPQAAQGTNVGLKFARLVRGVLTTELGGFDTLIGFGSVTGTAGRPATVPVGGVAGVGPVPMDLLFVDVQAQGEIGDMSLGIYGDFANAKGKTSTDAAAAIPNNFYGGAAAGGKFDAWSLRAELKPLHNMGFGIGVANNKLTSGVAGTIATKVATTQVAAFYEIYQNFEINLIYNSAKTSGGGTVAAPAVGTTTNTTTIEFEALM